MTKLALIAPLLLILPFISADDRPAIELNESIMKTFRPLFEQYYFDETRFDTY